MNQDANVLLGELMRAPQDFVEQGRGYQLLQVWLRDLPVVALRPLLQSGDPWVQRTAAFIASELGSAASAIVADVVPLLVSTDIHAQNYAMEVLTVCATGENAALFAHVVQKLESTHKGILLQAMDFVRVASRDQIAAALACFEPTDRGASTHRAGLQALLSRSQLRPEDVVSMLRAPDRLLRRYGAVLADALGLRSDSLRKEVGTDDTELSEFFAHRPQP